MKWFMKLGIRKKAQVIILGVFILCVVVCGGVSFGVYKNLGRKNIQETVDRVSVDVQNQLEQYFDQVNEVAWNLAYSTWLQNPMIAGNISVPGTATEIKNNMSSLSFLYSEIRFAVITLEGETLVGNGIIDFDYNFRIEEQPWYETLLEEKKYIVFEEEQPFQSIREKPSVTIFYTFNNYQTLDPMGYLLVRVPMKNLENLLKKLAIEQCHGELFLPGKRLGADGTLPEELPGDLTEKPSFLKGTTLCANKRMLYVYGRELPIYTAFDWKGMNTSTYGIWAVLLAVLLLIGISLLFIAMTISRYLTKPILECKEAMEEIQNNHLGITLENSYQDEIGELVEGFNKMSQSIGELIETNKRISVIQKEAEFKILERQLNPHFLFNSLELINSLVLSKDNASAGYVCTSLGQLYRYNLRHEKWISFREELEYTRKYLEVMSYKMESLDTDYDIDEAVLDTMIIKATLQPLVENSIRHGFRRIKQENCISLIVYQEEEKIHISVMDNGQGMPSWQNQQLNEEILQIRTNPDMKLPESAHVGVKNVFQRLFLEYGEELEFEIISRENAGTRIEIAVPERRSNV